MSLKKGGDRLAKRLARQSGVVGCVERMSNRPCIPCCTLRNAVPALSKAGNSKNRFYTLLNPRSIYQAHLSTHASKAAHILF